MADVTIAHHSTPYLLLGDWFAWLALAVLVFTFAQFYQSKNRLV